MKLQITALCLLSVVLTACGAPDAAPAAAAPSAKGALPQGHPSLDTGGEVAIAHEVQGGAMRRPGPPVELPEALRARWGAVRLRVTDKDGNGNEIRALIGEETATPVQSLTLRAGPYVPSYMSDGTKISSASDQPENPAVLVALLRDGEVINEGWIFRDWPQFNTLASHWMRVELLEAEAAEAPSEVKRSGGRPS